MKKLTLALSLVALAASASAFTSEDWVVRTTAMEDPITYTVLPKTAELVNTTDGPEVRVVVEVFTDSKRDNIFRRKLRVSGCDVGTGKTVLAEMNGTISEGSSKIFDWDKNGERVYDMLALRGCVAMFEKVKQGSKPAKQDPKYNS